MVDINCPDSPAIDVMNTVGSGGFIYPLAGTAAGYGRGRGGGGLYGRTRFTPEPRKNMHLIFLSQQLFYN